LRALRGAPASLRDGPFGVIIPTMREYPAIDAREERAMQISARNVLKGTVTDVKKGATTAHVSIDVNGTIVTASITNESVDSLKLAKGKPAFAIIKASNVMVGVE
jgi:molybdopterin-binding protein